MTEPPKIVSGARSAVLHCREWGTCRSFSLHSGGVCFSRCTDCPAPEGSGMLLELLNADAKRVGLASVP